MKKKIFAVSDIHGNYMALEKSLIEAGYNEDDENNMLIVCGDMFDRGCENLEIYKQLKRLSDEGKAIVIRGNHDAMLIDYLNGKNVSPFNYVYNGTNETLADFLHETRPFESWSLLNDRTPTLENFNEWITGAVKDINEEYPELLPWLENLPYYYETEKYIFTHGAIDTDAKDWHVPKIKRYSKEGWEALMWDDGNFFGKYIGNTDKTIVIGHFSTRHLRKMYDINDVEDRDMDGILYRHDKKIIALDACTILTHKVNVLVVEDEII